jgi:beta-glucosidase-like glycosyl hydrolase
VTGVHLQLHTVFCAVPDIFLTANERKRRLQDAKREEQRLREEAAAACERARLEKEAQKLRIREERKKEAEERRLKAKEEKAKAAEEKQLQEKAGVKGELKAGEGTVVVGVTPEEEKERGGGGSLKGKKRGRPRKVKAEGAQKEPSTQGAEGGNVGEVILLSESEKEEAQMGPSLLEKMEKRQKEFRESIRESQEVKTTPSLFSVQ